MTRKNRETGRGRDERGLQTMKWEKWQHHKAAERKRRSAMPTLTN